jgi:hypothetical protein
MSNATFPIPPTSHLAALQATFLTHVLPRVEAHGRIYFRHVKCPHRKEELLAEMRGLVWKWYVGLIRRGKNVLAFVSALATYAARAVHSGRRVCGHERKREVLSLVARRLHGFAVEALPHATSASHERLYASPHGQERLDAFEERLRDNTQTPPDEQAAFRIDFPAWRRTHSERDRRLIDTLMLGERTKDVSRKFGLSQGRISQKRRQFREDWRRFCGESVEE